MAQTGYTPISLYYSTTAAAVPTSGNLANGELGINITDGKLYYKNNSGVVTLLASSTTVTNSFSAGSTGFTPSTATTGAVTLAGTLATTNGGTGLTSFTSGGVVFASSSSALATGSALTFDGTTFSAPNSVITSSSSSNALRITQTGSGNALLVEDEASPDSSPFVVDTNGQVIQGYTSAISSGVVATNPYFQMHGVLNGTTAIGLTNWSSTGGRTPSLNFNRSAGNAVNTRGALTTIGTSVGMVSFTGDDGTSWLETARIEGAIDATPGTNDMPGRLVFSTTADGASSPTERVRIKSDGTVGIGSTSSGGFGGTLDIRGSGSPTSGYLEGTLVAQTIPSSVTVRYDSFYSNPSTQATSFTLSSLRHFYANQGTIGAGSSVTNQMGFYAESALTGATNNYGFFGNIASGTGRYNLYMNGTADNYLAGSLGIGATALTDRNLGIGKNITGATAAYGVVNNGQIQSDVTSLSQYYRTTASTAASTIKLTTLDHFSVNQGTIGAGSAVTSQAGFNASSSLTGATNNYGFYGAIPSGTGRYNLYMAGTADNYLAGSTGIGGVANADTKINIGGTLPSSSANSKAVFAQYTIPSTSTNQTVSYLSYPSTQATAFTATQIIHFYANQGTIGAGSSVTNQIGFQAESTLTGATNNYGFYGNLASGTGRYNLYMNGTADNYIAGNVGIGTLPSTARHLTVGSSLTGSTTDVLVFGNGTVQTDVTASARYFQATTSTLASAFTLTELIGFYANQGAIGAGSTVTNQYGFSTATTLTGATNNYGFFGNIASGTGRWNFYAAGTAQNFFNGDVITNGKIGLGTASSPSYGTSGQVLTSGGSAAAPTWTTVSGGGSAATPTALGTVYGAMDTGAYGQAFIGYQAGNGNTTSAANNTAMGNAALYTNTGAAHNSAFGFKALYFTATGGDSNSAFGSAAMYSNTTGANNVAIGRQALYNSTTGTASVAVGYQSLYTSSCSYTTAIGYQSGYKCSDTSGGEVFVGYQAGYNQTSALQNTIMGVQAGYSNVTSNNNTYNGFNAGYYQTGAGNTGVGSLALIGANGTSTGSNNTAVGYQALNANTTASNNTAVGYQASSGGTLANNVSIGYQALYTGGNNDNVAIGYQALYTEGNTGNGQNVAIGSGASKISLASAYNNVFVGFRAGFVATSAGSVTCVGATAGYTLTTGGSVTCIGQNAGTGITTGSGGTYIGANTTASSSSASNELVLGVGNGPTGKGSSTAFINANGGGTYNGANSATWSVTSDQRLKKNIVDNNVGLSAITAIQVRNFEYRTEDEVTDLPKHSTIPITGVQIGAIAQELETILPDCVKTESTGVMSLNTDSIMWHMINAIKELNAKITALEAKLGA